MKTIVLFISLCILITGCREKFYADISSPATGYLIVEGIINVGDDVSTVITLSRTTALDSQTIKYEENAQVYIENEQTLSYLLNYTGGGRYESAVLDLPVSGRYRVHIIAAGKEYYSDFTEAKLSPEIDSLYWVQKSEGVEILLDTHDPQANSQYYYWNFVETWEYSVPYYAVLKYNKATNEIEERGPQDPQMYSCWSTLPSSSIVVTSTVNLNADNVYGKPITFVSTTNTDKLVTRYSILVRQSVLTKDAFEYMDRMRRNTETTGSIFDAQPSQLRGNISCATDSSETVVGFISSSSITEKRIFINRRQLSTVNIPTHYEICLRDTTEYHPRPLLAKFQSGYYLPIDYWRINGIIVAVTSSTDYCVDCRLKGGSNVRPSFW